MRFEVIAPSAAVIAALLAAVSASAQIYRAVGPDGRVTYSDQPSAAASARSSNQTGGASATAGLPYELAQAVQKYPVTLYTGQGCAPCNSGRNLLIGRGIPFTEKTIDSNDDIAALKKIAGNANLPLVTIGGQQLSGFQDSDWSQYLSAAGYPQTSQLPGSYHSPPAAPLAPKTQEPVTAAAPAAASAADMPEAPVENAPAELPHDPDNPAGIRF